MALNMDKDHPEWLTLDFLNQCIRSKEKYREVTTTSFTAESAVPPGNNYGSYILRVKASLQDQSADDKRDHTTLSLIIKCPLIGGAIKELFDNIHESEPVFYNEFLPLSRQLMNRSLTADHFRSPILGVVVLEDLAEKGFVMANKLKQLDFDHCRLYMTAAADLHAMSFAVHKQHPDLIRRISKEKLFSNDMDQAKIDANKSMVRYAFESFADHVTEFLENDRISRIVRKCSTQFWDILVNTTLPNDTFNTLNQGDPWITNMMFKRDETGRAYDIKLLDFQCLRYASPVSDLVFFMWTSANYNVLQSKQNNLYETYLEYFNNALEEMNFEERLTMKTIREHIAQQSPVALWAVALGRPMIMQPTVNVELVYSKCMEEYSPDNNPFEELYTESFCKNDLPQLVEYLDNSGAIDYIEALLEKDTK